MGASCPAWSTAVRGAHADQIPQAALTVCRLRASQDVLRQRFLGRGGQAGLVEDVLRESAVLDVSDFSEVCIGRQRPGRGRGGAARVRAQRRMAARPGRPALKDASGTAKPDSRTVQEVADVIVAQTGWPDRAA